MKNKEHLDIDYTIHVEYLQSTKKVLLRRLKERFGPSEGSRLWEEAKHRYEQWCRDLPYIGGRENNQCHSFYDSIICFAYWDVMPQDKKESVEEFTDTVSLIFCKRPFDRGLLKNGRFTSVVRSLPLINCNRRRLLKLLFPLIKLRFRKINKKKAAGEWNNAWGLDFPAEQPRDGIRMRLVGCPVSDFARAHHFEHLMPAMCNPDYEVLRPLGACFIRTTVVAQGYGYCDQTITGDKSDSARHSVIKKDENGFLYSEYTDGRDDHADRTKTG